MLLEHNLKKIVAPLDPPPTVMVDAVVAAVPDAAASGWPLREARQLKLAVRPLVLGLEMRLHEREH